jgi:hypothetical protein
LSKAGLRQIIGAVALRRAKKPKRRKPNVDWNSVAKLLDEAAAKLREAAVTATKSTTKDETLTRDLRLLAEEGLDLQQHAQALKLRTEAEAEIGRSS